MSVSHRMKPNVIRPEDKGRHSSDMASNKQITFMQWQLLHNLRPNLKVILVLFSPVISAHHLSSHHM